MPNQPSAQPSHTPHDLAEWRAIATAIGEEGGAFVLTGFRGGARITKKGAIDLVTEYDLENERLIRDRLSRALPHHRIVGEEADAQGEGDYVWYVDPIDGTTNFAHGHPFFCVSIGLFHRNTPLVGVVVAPALNLTWTAHTGGGASRNRADCRVSETDTLADALTATGFAYDRWSATDDNLAEHDRFVKTTRGVRRCGAAALDLAMTADGTYDVYWEQALKPWDVAAGFVLVSESGGVLTDYVGEPTHPGGGQIVASNGRVHAETLLTIAEARSTKDFVMRGGRQA